MIVKLQTSRRFVGSSTAALVSGVTLSGRLGTELRSCDEGHCNCSWAQHVSGSPPPAYTAPTNNNRGG